MCCVPACWTLGVSLWVSLSDCKRNSGVSLRQFSLSLNLGRKRDAVWLVLTGVQVVFAPLVKHHCQSHRMYRLVWNILIFLILVKFWRLTDVCLSVCLSDWSSTGQQTSTISHFPHSVCKSSLRSRHTLGCPAVFRCTNIILLLVCFLFFFFQTCWDLSRGLFLSIPMGISNAWSLSLCCTISRWNRLKLAFNCS